MGPSVTVARALVDSGPGPGRGWVFSMYCLYGFSAIVALHCSYYLRCSASLRATSLIPGRVTVRAAGPAGVNF